MPDYNDNEVQKLVTEVVDAIISAPDVNLEHQFVPDRVRNEVLKIVRKRLSLAGAICGKCKGTRTVSDIGLQLVWALTKREKDDGGPPPVQFWPCPKCSKDLHDAVHAQFKRAQQKAMSTAINHACHVMDGIVFRQEGWEANEDIVTINRKPIGGTISRRNRQEWDRYWPAAVREIKKRFRTILEEEDDPGETEEKAEEAGQEEQGQD